MTIYYYFSVGDIPQITLPSVENVIVAVDNRDILFDQLFFIFKKSVWVISSVGNFIKRVLISDGRSDVIGNSLPRLQAEITQSCVWYTTYIKGSHKTSPSTLISYDLGKLESTLTR